MSKLDQAAAEYRRARDHVHRLEGIRDELRERLEQLDTDISKAVGELNAATRALHNAAKEQP